MSWSGPLPRLHVVTDDTVLKRADVVRVAGALFEAHGAAVALHVRGPGTTGGRLHALTRELVAAAGEHGALLLVNDRVDVARITGADGAQLGARSLPVPVARGLLGTRAIIGCSVHGVEEAHHAADAGADVVMLGTLFPTPSHPGRQGIGASAVRNAAACGIPVLGIGGITPERALEVRRAGGHGAAVIRAVWTAADPVAAAGALLDALEAG